MKVELAVKREEMRCGKKRGIIAEDRIVTGRGVLHEDWSLYKTELLTSRGLPLKHSSY
jgi:hypothetical protein